MVVTGVSYLGKRLLGGSSLFTVTFEEVAMSAVVGGGAKNDDEMLFLALCRENSEWERRKEGHILSRLGS